MQSAFASEALYRAKPLSKTDVNTMLTNSCSFVLSLKVKGAAPGSPDESVHTQTGMARIVTGYVTFVGILGITDVSVERDYQGIGSENWLIQCCNEIIQEIRIPALRCAVLLGRRRTPTKIMSVR
jgi:hypothetical protein